MLKQTLSNWVRLAEKGELQGAGERPVSGERSSWRDCAPSWRESG
jgi:hypothetical protein